MAIALFSFFRSLFAPRRAGTCARQPQVQAPQGGHACPPYVVKKKPVRVVRTQGRMVISGRLADVCAELDRLAALEAAQALAPAR
jgi:hypothetical protein